MAREVEIVARTTPTEIVAGARVVGFSKSYFPSGDVAAGMVQKSTGVDVMVSLAGVRSAKQNIIS